LEKWTSECYNLCKINVLFSKYVQNFTRQGNLRDYLDYNDSNMESFLITPIILTD